MTEAVKKYVTDSAGNRTAVILDIKVYEQLIDEIDELNCALAFDKAKKENAEDIAKGKVITLERFVSKRQLKKIKH